MRPLVCAPRALLRFAALRLALPLPRRVAASSTAAATLPLELIDLDSAISAAEERVGGIQRVVEASQRELQAGWKELNAAKAALEPLVKRRASLRAKASLPAWLDRTLGKLKAEPNELAALRKRLEAGLSGSPLAICGYEDDVMLKSSYGNVEGLTRRRCILTLRYVFDGKGR